VIVGGTPTDNLQNLGGKRLHLDLLLQGGFKVPETFTPEDIPNLQNSRLYIVRSSAAGEDGHTKTSAGKYLTLKGINKDNLESAVHEVRSRYLDGNVVIQPDLSLIMEFSGVVYSNLNGSCVISGGRKNFVQQIVEGTPPETEVMISNGKSSQQGLPINPRTIRQIYLKSREVEDYFGIPMDIEFAVIDGEITLLQARPLPNPTESALREHEVRRLKKTTSYFKNLGLDEVVLGVGNYREILANTKATHLSSSTFNYIFSGNGEDILGAVQLGRNELGYDLGTEIFPWVIMLNGKVYYNFAGDALQFRPKGIEEKDLLHIINEVYLPTIRGNPDLLNYPELRLYIQFPEQAKQVGLDPQPFGELAERNRKAIQDLQIPSKPPLKRRAKKYGSLERCLNEINSTIEDIRLGSAKEYVKAARLAFFALEDVRVYLERLQKEQPTIFEKVTSLFDKKTPEQLRDAVVYDQSIGSFELEEREEFRYLGSFELSQPRGFPPKRHFKPGKDIPDTDLANLVKKTREVLEYREKVKFPLFRDYDYLKQLYQQAGQLSGFKKDIYYLEFNEIKLLNDKPPLARYRIELKKKVKDRQLLPDPIFESDLESGTNRISEKRPQLIFGLLPQEGMCVTIGKEGYVVESVDQTVEIPEKTSIVLVPENVKPGSHLFTVLSDYNLPVVGVPQEHLNKFRDFYVKISLKNGFVDIKKEW